MGPSRLLSVFVAGAVIAIGASAGAEPVRTDGPLLRRFDESARANGVPRELLIAIAATEGGLAIPAHRHVELHASVPSAGPLQLRHGRFDSLARGAALMHTTELALREDADLALEAGARVAAELGERLGADVQSLATWRPALEELSGYADDAHRAGYASRVLALLRRGGSFVARDGEVIALSPQTVPEPTLVPRPEILPADYGPAEWFPTPETNKWTTGRGGVTIDRIVIHDTEGGWDASVATLQNDPNKSVHYIVGTDGTVGQFVHESDTAWHAGNWAYNEASVGIEHVGYYTAAYPEPLYAASAELVLYLTAKYGISKDRTHVIGHDQIPNGNVMAESSPPCEASPAACETGASYGGTSNHRDPGDFEWCPYMVERLAGACKCNDVTALWTCTSDFTAAVRCAGGVVQIEQCTGVGGCQAGAAGQPATCHLAAPTGDAGAPAPDAGGAGVDAGAHVDGGDHPDAGASHPSTATSSGCSTGEGASGGASLLLPAVAGLLVLAKRRYHRRRC